MTKFMSECHKKKGADGRQSPELVRLVLNETVGEVHGHAVPLHIVGSNTASLGYWT